MHGIDRPWKYVKVHFKPDDERWDLYHLLGNVEEIVDLGAESYGVVGGSCFDYCNQISVDGQRVFERMDSSVGFRMVIDCSSAPLDFKEKAAILE